jgi:putative oxidoreductase
MKEDSMSTLLNLYARAVRVLNALEGPLLLAIRLYWGWQFATDGWGKVHHLARVGAYFAELNLPMPQTTAAFVSVLELVGGVLLAIGLGTRVVSLLLFINMTVAFWTAEKDAFLGVLSNPDKFQGADAYNYWFAVLLILILGSGWIAADTLVARLIKRKFAPAQS